MKSFSILVPLCVVLFLCGFFTWTFCRIQVPAGHMAIVTAKIVAISRACPSPRDWPNGKV